LVYIGHFSLDVYHAETWVHHFVCLFFIGLPLAAATAAVIFVHSLWCTSEISRVKKVCLTVSVIAIGGATFMVLGFMWLLVHLAP